MIHLLLAAQIIDYQACKSHQQAVQEEEHNKALKKGISVPLHKVVHNVPDSTISIGLQNMCEKERQTVEKLHEIAFTLPSKSIPSPTFRPN